MNRLSPTKWLPPLPVSLSALASGALLAASFPPFSLSYLSFIALVPVIVALGRRSYPRKVHFQGGYLFGVAFFLAHLYWIVQLIPASSITIPGLMVPALVLLVAYLATYPGLVFLLTNLIARRHRLAMIMVGPSVWALIELFRSSGVLGFPWGAVGYSLSQRPTLIQPAALVGVYGVGWLIILVNFIFAVAVLGRTRRARVSLAVVGVGIVAANGAYGSWVCANATAVASGDGHTVAVVQPDVDLELKWKPEFRDSTFNLIDRLTRQSASLGSSLIVFPETSAPVYIRHADPYRVRLQGLADELGVSIFIGCLDGRYEGPDHLLNVYNSSALFSPHGNLRFYDKMHLLPFGEAFPWWWRFRWLAKIDFGQANFHPGRASDPLPSPAGSLGPMICFESIFPGLSRRFVDLGADLLVNITNDGWFGDTPGPYQHNDMAIFRAVENHRFLVRSANTGVSMIVDPVGRIVVSLGLFEEGVVAGRIHPVEGTTIYTRYGDLLIVIGALSLLVSGAVVARRSAWRAKTDASP